MLSYKKIFTTLITTDNYISVDLIKQFIETNKNRSLSEAALNKELLRKFDRFVKIGLLEKTHNGTNTVYIRSELTKQIHQTYGTKKLLDAYELIEFSRDNEFHQVIDKISSLLDTEQNNPQIGFSTPYFQVYQPSLQYQTKQIYKFINSFLLIITS